jgi:hypothetical protein
MNCPRSEPGTTAALLFLIAAIAASGSARGETPSPEPLSCDTIVERLIAANARRAEALRGYRCKRFYHLDYSGFLGRHEAEMQVQAAYIAPDRKDFKIVSESGSKLLLSRVLLKLLDSEQEAQRQQDRQELELTPKNYEFALADTQHTTDGNFYVLDVTPRRKTKYLYRGKIWVEAQDFAVARMEGEPVKNPSFWISHTQIEYRWANIAGFWLPVHNRSETQVRMGGKALLTIGYTDYEVTGTNPAGAKRNSGKTSELPSPAAVSGVPH